MKIILASNSPRRKDLLNQIGLTFDIMPSDIDEDLSKLHGDPSAKAEQLAEMKARHIANKVDGGLIIGADTVVVVDDLILGKPADDDDAYKMLTLLNGREHQVTTGISIVDVKTKKYITLHETSVVKFNNLTEQEIREYIRSKESEGKAGAYAIQGLGALLVEYIKGDYFNIVGLPLNKLNKALKEFENNLK